MVFFINVFLVYLTIMNILLFGLMWADKRKARKETWRIPERTLWIMAFLGGSTGGWMAMKLFRHKTKHRRFAFGFPIVALLQLSLVLYGLGQF